MNDLLSEHESLQRLDDDFANSSAFFGSLFLSGVPQFIVDADCAERCGCHLAQIHRSSPAWETNFIVEINSSPFFSVKVFFCRSQNLVGFITNIAICSHLLNRLSIESLDRINNAVDLVNTLKNKIIIFIMLFANAKIFKITYRKIKIAMLESSRTSSDREIAFFIGSSTHNCCASTASVFDIRLNSTISQNSRNFIHIKHCAFHDMSFRSAPELVAVYTDYTSVYTDASLVRGVSND